MSVYIALLVHYLIYGGLLAIYRIIPRQFYARAKETTITAFVTRSSGGTLPVSLDVTQIKMGVSPRCFFIHAAVCRRSRRDQIMKHCTPRLLWLLMVLVSLFAAAGCSGSAAKIRKVDSPTEKELRANWQNFHTYCLEGGYGISQQGNAILFQLKGDKTIQKSDGWSEVTSGQMASSCASFLTRSSPVMQLRGDNDEIFGYVIYNFRDGISASIIDPKTMRLFYYVSQKSGR